jgi:hypothetical protein
MKKILPVLVVAALIFFAGRASAFIRFTQNEFITAESLDPGMTQTGIYFTLGDHYKSYYPQFRYGLGAFAEAGIRVGATSARFNSGDKLGALIGADLKYQLIKETEGIPLDMAVDLGFDNTIINSGNASELSFATILSKGLPLTERGYKLTPYAGFEMTALYGSAVPRNDTSFYAFAGLEWKLSRKFMILLEFKGGDEQVGGAGIRFEY